MERFNASTVAVLLLAGISLNYIWSAVKRRSLRRPPGPPGYPIIGNYFDHPTDQPWIVYNEWAKTYGDMVYYEVFGQPLLVLSSMKRVNDLFDKRSKNYSDRLHQPMLTELMHWDIDFAFLPYGSWWRRHRRPFHQHFNPAAVPKYKPVQEEEVHAFTLSLAKGSDNLFPSIRRTLAAIIMRVTYGIPVESLDSEYITRADITFNGLAVAGIQGTYLVDHFPFLKHIPAWFPGAKFKRIAAYYYSVNRDIRKIPFNVVKKQLEEGVAPPSVAASLIKSLPPTTHPDYEAEERLAENVTAVAYLGGADTTISAVQAFFILMALHPEVAKKAQDQLDLVVGSDRLPEWDDRESLPYIEAIAKEIMRWHPVTPLAVPHMATEDDVYEGYFIPKGTVVIGNAWGILHDSKVFKDPDVFRPERYLDANGQIDETVLDPAAGGAFGFGRRICPGRYLGNETLYLLISTILSVYNITPKLDENGKYRKLEYTISNGVIVYPGPFECDIKPRNAKAEALVQALATSD